METVAIFTAGGGQGNPGPAAVGVSILDAKGKVLKEVSEAIGNATDTFAEYYAVMRGLQTAKEHFGEKTKALLFEIKLDGELVKKQLNSESEMKEPGLVPYFIEIHNLRVSSFPNLVFTHIGAEDNKEARLLADMALGIA